MMTYTRMQNRLGMTAIAAVLALSSTSLVAQVVPDTTAPVEATTTTMTPEPPAAPAVDPLAPTAEPEATAPVAEVTATTEPEPSAKQSAKKTATKTVSKAKQTAAKTAPSTTFPAPAPLAEATTAPVVPVTASEPAPEVAPVAEAQSSRDAQINEALPIAGGAGAVILALAGVGMAVRRKRRHEDEEFEHNWIDDDEITLADEVEPEVAVAEPAASWDPPVRAPELAATPAAMRATEVSDSFDTSGFGRHVKAAYEGPTPENPSLSLRKRLKIAGELDRREREAGINLKPASQSKPVTVPMPEGEKMAMSFGGSATQPKVNEYQF